MTKEEALLFLAESVAEAITEAQCDISIFTGIEWQSRIGQIQGKNLADALEVLGFIRAAMKVRRVLEAQK